MDLLSCSELLLVRRQGVYYLSVAAAGFLVFIIVLAILKGGRNSYLTNILCVKEYGAICYIDTALRFFWCFYSIYPTKVTLKIMRFLLFFVPVSCIRIKEPKNFF